MSKPTLHELMKPNAQESLGKDEPRPDTQPMIPNGSAFTGQTWKDAAKRSREVVLIPIGKIAPDPDQPRQEIDEEELARLAETIRSRGVLQPIVVRPDAEHERWIIIAGERRWRASRMAGLESIPATERSGLDIQEIRLLQLVENCARADLNPLEKARGIRSLLDESGWTQKQAAEYLGISTAQVSQTLRLLELPEEQQQAVVRGEIGVRSAYELARDQEPAPMPEAADRVQRRKQAIREGRRYATKSSRTDCPLRDGKVTIVLKKPAASLSDYRAALRAALKYLEGRSRISA